MPSASLPYRVEIPVLGFPTCFYSNSAAVIDVVHEAFDGWNTLHAHPHLIESSRVTVRIVIDQDPQLTEARDLVQFEADGRVIQTMRGCIAISDPVQRIVGVRASPAMLQDRQRFRYAVIEGSALPVLTYVDRVPLHAAAVTVGDAALLLAGPSGIGKSTLLYALVQNGFRVITDDVVFVQTRPRSRIWGLPRFLHLSEESRRFYPELNGTEPRLLANGKTKIAVDLHARRAAAAQPFAERAGICLLEREGGDARYHRIPADQLLEKLTHKIEPGFDLFRDEIAAAVRPLVQGGGWRLQLGDHPTHAIPLVQQIVAELSAGPRAP